MRTIGPRSPIELDRLLDAIRQGNDATVIETFRGRTEAERRANAPAVFKAVHSPPYPERSAIPHAYRDTAVAALFACGTLTEIKRLDRRDHTFGTMCNDVALQVLVDRRPSWVTAWAEWALDRNATPSGRADGLWWLVRQLIRAGVCERLDSDGYILGMLFGLSDRRYTSRSRWHGDESHGIPRDDAALDQWHAAHDRGNVSLVDRLRADPDLLDHEIWRVFEVPGRPSCQLGGPPDPWGDPWIATFATLARDGDVARHRLLGATLGALARDITQYQSGWFIALWHALEASDAERLAFQDEILHLLAHAVSTVVRFAVEELDRLDEAEGLDVLTFLTEVDGVLMTAPVAVAEDCLRLLERIGTRDPDQAEGVCIATAPGLLHANVKVRSRAAKLLGRSPQRYAEPVIEAIESAGFADAAHEGSTSLVQAVEREATPTVRTNAAVSADRDDATPPPPRIAAWRRLLVAYLDEWLPMSLRDDHVVGIVDVSPGPWRFDTGDAGSPVFVLDAVLGHPRFHQWRSKTFKLQLVEPDPQHSSALGAAVDAVASRCGGVPENVKVRVDTTHFASRVRPFEREMAYWNGPFTGLGRRRLALLDPFRTSTPMLKIASVLGASWDVLIHFDCDVLEHASRQSVSLERKDAYSASLTSMFAGIERARGTERVIELYERQLRAVAHFPHVLSCQLLSSGAATGEFMVFGTSGEPNLRRMKDVMWAIDPETGSRFTSPEEPIAPPIGDDYLGPLARAIHAEFQGRTVVVDEVKHFTLVSTRFRDNAHVRPALALLEREGKLNTDAGTRRRGTLPRRAAVTFPTIEHASDR